MAKNPHALFSLGINGRSDFSPQVYLCLMLSGVPRTVWLIASMWVPTPLVEAVPTQILMTCTSELPFPSGGNESYQGVLREALVLFPTSHGPQSSPSTPRGTWVGSFHNNEKCLVFLLCNLLSIHYVSSFFFFSVLLEKY